MSQNTHKGLTSHRRPVNSKNGEQRIKQTREVLAFLKGREAKDAK